MQAMENRSADDISRILWTHAKLASGGDLVEDSSAVFLLEQLLTDALAQSATDIHLAHSDSSLVASFRTNGTLTPYVSTESAGGPLLRRIKALAGLDMTERRQPQDGAFRWEGAGTRGVDIRVSTSPIATGESVVLRLLPDSLREDGFTDLGMTPEQARTAEALLNSNTGLLLVAGQTGAGKTTTLYAMMRYAASRGRAVVSIEDPVEMPLQYTSQLEVREQTGVTFERALRTALRQDPDVLMIGEIRDRDTARTAMHAALSGHLVLSTTHATDPIGAAARLVEYGLPRSLLGDVILSVVVQSFVQSHCLYCQGSGCSRCRQAGTTEQRQMHFQFADMTSQLRALISSDLSWMEVRLRCQGVLPLATEQG